MNEPQTINIHGKEYTPVSERVKLLHQDQPEGLTIETHTKIEAGYVICEAAVVCKRGSFTGTSAVHLENSRSIEKENPFEVAETSAIGRALGFANYGLTESVASADEMKKAGAIAPTQPTAQAQTSEILAKAQAKRENTDAVYECPTCGSPADFKVGTSKAGKPYRGLFCVENREHVKWMNTGENPLPATPISKEVNAITRVEQPETPELEEVDPADIPF